MLTETNLYREIFEQPAAIKAALDGNWETCVALAEAIRERNISHVVIAARGTSDNAGRYAQYVLGAFNQMTVTLATPSLFSIYEQPPKLDRTLVLGISQSGKSADIVSVVAEGRRQGQLTAVITNTPDSDLAQQGDFVIDLGVGIEKAVAATKTYTASLAAIALLSTALAKSTEMRQALEQMPAALEQTLTMCDEIAAVAPRYRYMGRSVVIGRGFNYATAFEMALKLKELTYTIVEPYSSADFQHGPLALIEPGFPVIVIAPSGRLSGEMGAFARTLTERQAEVIVISDDETLLAQARIPLRLPAAVPEWLSPITAILPGQLLALFLAHERDYDIDAPRGIHKVTSTH